MMILSHKLSWNDNEWLLEFSIDHSDLVPKKCILTRNGKYVDIITINDLKAGIGTLTLTDKIVQGYKSFYEAENVKNDMINKISQFKDDFECLFLNLRDDSQTMLKT